MRAFAYCKLFQYSDVAFLSLGILFMENHFKVFSSVGRRSYPRVGGYLRTAWLFAATLLSMSYQGNLKVGYEAYILK